jgi:hypothetical protein
MAHALTSAVVFLSASLLVEAAAAQTPPSEATKRMAGSWEISNADRDKICLVTLQPQTAPGGLKLEFDKACAGVFPFVKGVSAWTIGGDSVRFVDSKSKPVLEVGEVEDGMFQGEQRGEGLYFMQRPGAANDLAPERFPEN